MAEQTAKEQMLQDIGWRLVTSNAEFCSNPIPAVGLQLHDMASYGDPQAVRALLGLDRDFAVLTVAAQSPAALAGLAGNQEIVALDEVDPSAWPAAPRRDWQRVKRAHDWIDQQLADYGEITVRRAEGEPVALKPVKACATRFELGGDSKRALAEGSRVVIGRDFPGFGYAEDELAAAIAHELAHNLLQHREWLDREGRKRRNVRLTEREADRLMPWLLANAGYDPAAAFRFMKRWGPSHDGGIFRKRTHDGWDERAEFISYELPQIAALLSLYRAADWQLHFRREIDLSD